jgi:hypothetical protein
MLHANLMGNMVLLVTTAMAATRYSEIYTKSLPKVHIYNILVL